MPFLTSFTKFTQLPPELQLQIWESTIACQPSMHLFDVCVPPCVSEPALPTITSPTSNRHNDGDGNTEDTDTRLSKGEEAIYLEEVTDTLYLSPLATTTKDDIRSEENSNPTQGAIFRSDPSMYRFRGSLAATCIDAVATVRRSTTAVAGGRDTNTIYLGAPSTARGCASITYDNTQDVLHLRFVPPAFRFPEEPGSGLGGPGRLTGPISAIFESAWSQELEGALRRARRVAIDVSQLWPDLAARLAGGEGGVGAQEGDLGQGSGEQEGEGGAADVEMMDAEEGEEEEEEGEGGFIDDASLILQDIAFLVSTMHHNLEVLYLVDYCAGRCNSHLTHPPGRRARDLMARSDDGLYRALRNGDTWEEEKMRKPDVIQGVGKVWREVFDLENLGWDEEHPGFVFAETFAEVVKMHQETREGDDSQEGDKATESVKFKGVRVLVAEDEEVNGEDSSMVLRCDGHRHGLEKEDLDP